MGACLCVLHECERAAHCVYVCACESAFVCACARTYLRWCTCRSHKDVFFVLHRDALRKMLLDFELPPGFVEARQVFCVVFFQFVVVRSLVFFIIARFVLVVILFFALN